MRFQGQAVLVTGGAGGDVAVWSAAGKSVGGLFATPLGGRIEIGDSDGTTLATFARTGTVNTTTGNLILATQIYVDNEFE